MKRRRIHKRGRPFILLAAFLLLVGCKNPISEEEQNAIVNTLVSGTLSAGEYVLFWDGTNARGQTVSPGTYYARLYATAFTYQIEMTALEGGTGTSNDSSYASPGLQPLTQLGQNHPNPFPIQDGTNIPFTLSQATAVQLTIRNRE